MSNPAATDQEQKTILSETREILEKRDEYIKAVCAQINDELQQINSEVHPEYQKLLATLDVTRLRILSIAEIQYQLAVQHAKHTLDFTKSQITNDYELGKEDIKEKLYGDLRRRKKELRELVDTLVAQNVPISSDTVDLMDIKIPTRRRNKDPANSKPKRNGKDDFNFKLSEHEIRQDIAYVKSLAEEANEK